MVLSKYKIIRVPGKHSEIQSKEKETMKKLFFKVTDKLDKVKAYDIEEYILPVTEENNQEENELENKDKEVIQFNKQNFTIIKEDELPDEYELLGYVRVAKKQGKKLKIKEKDMKKELSGSLLNKVAILREKKSNDRIIGYLKIAYKENTFIAIVKKVFPVIIILPIFFLLLGLGGSYWYYDTYIKLPDLIIEDDKDNPDFVDDDGNKGSGELEVDKAEFGEQATFRMRLNVTPQIQDNKINIRIESPDHNEELKFRVKVYVLSKLDSQGNVITDYGSEDFLIYESPAVLVNENIEYGEIIKHIEKGRYTGRAMYDIYNLENEYLGSSAARLDITVLN